MEKGHHSCQITGCCVETRLRVEAARPRPTGQPGVWATEDGLDQGGSSGGGRRGQLWGRLQGMADTIVRRAGQRRGVSDDAQVGSPAWSAPWRETSGSHMVEISRERLPAPAPPRSTNRRAPGRVAVTTPPSVLVLAASFPRPGDRCPGLGRAGVWPSRPPGRFGAAGRPGPREAQSTPLRLQSVLQPCAARAPDAEASQPPSREGPYVSRSLLPTRARPWVPVSRGSCLGPHLPSRPGQRARGLRGVSAWSLTSVTGGTAPTPRAQQGPAASLPSSSGLESVGKERGTWKLDSPGWRAAPSHQSPTSAGGRRGTEGENATRL